MHCSVYREIFSFLLWGYCNYSVSRLHMCFTKWNSNFKYLQKILGNWNIYWFDEFTEHTWLHTLLHYNIDTHLVGVKINAKIPKGSSDSFCRIGRANAAVLPLPVLAQPIQSFPKNDRYFTSLTFEVLKF
jgi:hypothetical protein